MDKRMIGACGAYCGICDWKTKTNCAGCQAAKGQMFWGTCAVATCCFGKEFAHCGKCPNPPCDMLKEVFDHPEHGDRGERLANLQAWARGEEMYLMLRPPHVSDDPIQD